MKKNTISETVSLVWRIFKRDQSLLALLLVILLFIFGQFTMPGFAHFSHIMTVIQAAFFIGLISLGETLVIISGREGIDLSVGAIFTMGVIVSAAIIDGQDSRIIIAFFAVLLTGFALGFVNGFSIAYMGIAPLIMTLGWGIAVEGLAYLSTGGFLPGKASPILEIICGKSLTFSMWENEFSIPWLVFVWLFIVLIVSFGLRKTRYGFMLYATGANERAAVLVGIRTNIVRIVVYGISGSCAALAGFFMLGYVGMPNLGLGIKYVLPSVVAAIIGGVSIAGGEGGYVGAVIGSIFLTSLLSILTTLGFGESARQMTVGFVLLLLLLNYAKRPETA
jgi:ribose transport system permease protein